MAGELTVFNALQGAVRTKAAVPRAYQDLEGRGGWYPIARPEWAFDRDIQIAHDEQFRNWTVFACMTLIAGDVAKMRIKLLERINNIPTETTNPAYSPVLRKPNKYQTRQLFLESWIISKLSRGNAYVLKARDNRNVVVGLHVLDPSRVKPLVAENGDVYYELHADDLAQVPDGERVVVPADEIIHDRFNCLFHPLIGIAPLYASGLAASQGLKIQQYSAIFFGNNTRPSGILTSPGFITDEQAHAYKVRWENEYGPGRQGKTAILGNGLEYKPIASSAVDSQMVEQLNASALMICSTFHVPGWKVGVGPRPAYQTADIENQVYYDTCLQPLIEGVESGLDEGLNTDPYKTELDLDALLRMDRAKKVDVLAKEVGSALASPDEGRAELGRQPVMGGNTPYLQQQNYSLEALSKRDKSEDPFGKVAPAIPALPAPEDTAKQIELANSVRLLVDEQKALELRRQETEENAVVAQFSVEVMKRFAETVDG